MGIMQMAADLTQQVTTSTGGFAIPVIFSTTNGQTVTAKTCNAVCILHGLYINEEGRAEVRPTSRVMVSERALKAAGFPTRDTNNRLSIKGCGVTFTDIVTGMQFTFAITMAVGNDMTGLTTCTLNYSGSVTPPGRTIIGWMPGSISVNVTATPSTNMQTLANGDQILTDYSLNANRTLTIPYMVGYDALSSFYINNREVQDIAYSKDSGIFNNGVHGGFNNGNQIKFDASIPVWQS